MVYLSLLATFKNESMNLRVWLEHYLWQGVEHFYLIDNGSTDNPMEILQEYIDKNLVSYYYLPIQDSIQLIYSQEKIFEKSFWLIICDLNDFFYGIDKSLNKKLQSLEYYGKITCNCCVFEILENKHDIRIDAIYSDLNLNENIRHIFRTNCISNINQFVSNKLIRIANKLIRLNHYEKVDNIRNMTLKNDILKNLIENPPKGYDTPTQREINEKLQNIHNTLTLKYGSFNEEKPEQKMVVRYLTGKEKVLEIGGNIGRNSLIISYLLNKQKNQNIVVLESDPNIAKQLQENRDNNHLKFEIEASALSKRNLIQKEWITMVSDKVLDGYTKVNTITWEELKAKYPITFDTLILDCEGAFYYILQDMPEILENINLIIMENDYTDINEKIYVDNVLKKNNFYVDYTESGGWQPCFSQFYQVWKLNL